MHYRIGFGKYPVIAFCGYGRAGKDTASEWFRDHTGLLFKGGCSWTARTYMASRLSAEENCVITPDAAYARRHEDRDKWYRYMNEYRKDDPSRLIRDCLSHSDIVCGVRDRFELLAAKRLGLIDLCVWVDRDVPVDTTVTYTVDDCDIVVRNRGSLEEYFDRLRRLAKACDIKVADG